MKYLLLMFFLAAMDLSAQCCSVGTPAGGTTNVGIVPEDNLRLASFFRYSHGDTYYVGSEKLGEGLVKNSTVGYIGFSAGYGLTEDLTIEAEAGYYPEKSQDYGNNWRLKGYGLSSAIISLKYNILDMPDYNFEFTAGLGGIIPFSSKEQMVDRVALPQDIQPSSGAYGGLITSFIRKGFEGTDLSLFLINRIELHASNNFRYKYQYGNAYITSLFLSKSLVGDLSGILQVRNEIHEKDSRDGVPYEQSGSTLLILSPQLNYRLDTWNFSVLYEYPFYRHYNDRQLATNYSVAFNISTEIDFGD